MVKSRPHYSKEFKLRICRELESGATVAEVSRKHQVDPGLGVILCDWLGNVATCNRSSLQIARGRMMSAEQPAHQTAKNEMIWQTLS